MAFSLEQVIGLQNGEEFVVPNVGAKKNKTKSKRKKEEKKKGRGKFSLLCISQ